MGLFPPLAGAHGGGLHRHRHQTHRPTVHHGGGVTHVQHVGAAAGPDALGAGTLVHPDLDHADLQEGLELEGGGLNG